MLYRFRSAATDAALRSDIATVAAGAAGRRGPRHAVLPGRQVQEAGDIAPFVPFLVAFGVIGLAMSVLIVANVVSGAVVAGYRRIGVLKSIGFTPGQVVAAYIGQAIVPPRPAALAGVVLGNCWRSRCSPRPPAHTASGPWHVPVWVDRRACRRHVRPGRARRAVPALRAGRLSAVQAWRPGARPGRSRLPRVPAARPAAAAPAGDDRARRPVRPPGTHRGDARRGAARRDRRHVRGRAQHVAWPGGGGLSPEQDRARAGLLHRLAPAAAAGRLQCQARLRP